MAMAILRTAKLKSLGNVAASLSHTYRTRETHNADPQRYEDNMLVRSPQAVLEDLKAKLPEKHRKDAVLCIEYLVSASPEWFEGKLNAKKWLGGRTLLSQMQTDFAVKVGKNHGLERGVLGSKAKHTSVKEFYAHVNVSEQKRVSLNPTLLEPKMIEKGFIRSTYESPEMVAKRVSEAVNHHFSPLIKKVEEADLNSHREAEKDRTIAALAAQRNRAIEGLKAFRDEFADLLILAERYPKAYVQMQDLAKSALETEMHREVQASAGQVRSAIGRSNKPDSGLER